jgi:glycosyltransferase involved in cell wall biosynthesis
VELSIVVPVYCGASFIAHTVEVLLSYLPARVPSFEIVLVDDGSPDDTLAVLRSLEEKRVRVVALSKNCGKFGAIKAGMAVARGRCRLFTDADLPYEVEAIPYTLSLIRDQGFHIVVGDRTLPGSEYSEHQAWPRAVASRAFSFLVTVFVTGGLFDTQCGLKGFHGDVAEALFPLLTDSHFSGDVELLYVALKYNLTIRRIPVRLRRSGPSTVSVLPHAMQMIGRIALLRRQWQTGRYSSDALMRLCLQEYWRTDWPPIVERSGWHRLFDGDHPEAGDVGQ